MLIKNENRIYATPAVKGLISLYTWHNSSGWILFKPRINLSPFFNIQRLLFSIYNHPPDTQCMFQCWFNVGPPSATLVQCWFNVYFIFCWIVCLYFSSLEAEIVSFKWGFFYIFAEKIALLIYFRAISKIIAVEETYPFLIFHPLEVVSR